MARASGAGGMPTDPGPPGFFHEADLGRNFTSFDEARPGDFMKVWWNDEIGARESGHSVVYLGTAMHPDGEYVAYWSSNCAEWIRLQRGAPAAHSPATLFALRASGECGPPGQPARTGQISRRHAQALQPSRRNAPHGWRAGRSAARRAGAGARSCSRGLARAGRGQARRCSQESRDPRTGDYGDSSAEKGLVALWPFVIGESVWIEVDALRSREFIRGTAAAENVVKSEELSC